MESKSSENEKKSTEIHVFGGKSSLFVNLSASNSNVVNFYPRICCIPEPVRSISCGNDFLAFLTMKGLVYTLGSNENGKLGVGYKSTKFSDSPVLVNALAKVPCNMLSTGLDHTVAVLENGEVYSWGNGKFGKLGLGSVESKWEPNLVPIPNTFPKIALSCGTNHTVLLQTNRSMVCWGRGENGELGTNDINNEYAPLAIKTPEQFVQCTGGFAFTLFLSEKGEVYSTGLNHQGQLGLGNKANSYIPQKIAFPSKIPLIKVSAANFSAALNSEGQIYVWGKGTFGEALKPALLSTPQQYFIDLEIKQGFGVAIDKNNEVYSWGENENGQLGIGNFEDQRELVWVRKLQGKNINKFSMGLSNYCIVIGDFINKSRSEDKEESNKGKILRKNYSENKMRNSENFEIQIQKEIIPSEEIQKTKKIEVYSKFNVYDMLKLTEANEKLKEDIQKLKEEIFVKDSKYDELTRKIERIEREQISEMSSKLIEATSEYKKLQEENEKLLKDLNSWQNVAEDTKKENQTLNEKIKLKDEFLQKSNKDIQDLQINLQQAESEANKLHFDLINYKEFNKSQGFKAISDVSQLQSNLKTEIEKNEELKKKLKNLEENNAKFQRSIRCLEEEKMLLDSKLKAQMNQADKSKNAWETQFKLSHELELKLEKNYKKMNERERQLLKENEGLILENESIKEELDKLRKENMLLIQKIHQAIEPEVFMQKINDLEKQNQYLFVKLQDKNKDFIELTEKFLIHGKSTNTNRNFVEKETNLNINFEQKNANLGNLKQKLATIMNDKENLEMKLKSTEDKLKLK